MKKITTLPMKKSTNRGRSLLEMLGVLAIIGILSIAALFGYQLAMTYHKANETIYDVMLRATNVPMVDEVYFQKPVDYEFLFPGLMQSGQQGRFYAMKTFRTNKPNYIYAVEVNDVPVKVCRRILDMKPTAIDLISVKTNNVEQDFTGENTAICGNEETLSMLFYFDNRDGGTDPDNPGPVDPDNPGGCNKTCDVCEALDTTTCTCIPSDDPCCQITPPGDCGCAETLYNGDGCPYGCGNNQTTQIPTGACCDGPSQACCPLTETCTACEPTGPCCGLSGGALTCCLNGGLTCGNCETANYETCSCEPDKCCDSPDPCCRSDNPCACNPDSPCCENPNSCACSPNAKCCVNPASCTCEERGGTQIISGYGDTRCCSEPTYCCSADPGCSAAGTCTPSKCCDSGCGPCSPCNEATGTCVPIECGECQQCNATTGGCELLPVCPFCSPSINSYDGACPTGGLGNDAVLTPVHTENGVGIACCRTCTSSSSPYHSASAFINAGGNKECCYGEAYDKTITPNDCDFSDGFPDPTRTYIGCCPNGTKAVVLKTSVVTINPGTGDLAHCYSRSVACCPGGRTKIRVDSPDQTSEICDD